jgi:predicted small secreted protein
MSKKIIILSLFIAVSILLSGCITDKNNGTKVNETKNINSDMIPTINLPSGFTYMGIHDTDIEVANSSKKATEGIYKIESGENIYVQVFKTEKPEELLDEFKAQYKDANYDPFTEISFNGHKATKVTYYFVSDGKQVPKYYVIWTINNSMIKVGSSTDDKKVIELATATNN